MAFVSSPLLFDNNHLITNAVKNIPDAKVYLHFIGEIKSEYNIIMITDKKTNINITYPIILMYLFKKITIHSMKLHRPL